MPAGGDSGRVPRNFRSAEECRKACIDIPGCAGFVFVKGPVNGHNCAVKTKWDPARKKPNNKCCDSGVVTEGCRKTGITAL